MSWLARRVALRPRNSLAVFALLLGLTIAVCSFAQQEKRPVVKGSDIAHPLYWLLEKTKSVEGIGDRSGRPAVVYAIRLKAGEQLVATMTTRFDDSLLPEPFLLYLFDNKTTSLMGTGTNWLIKAVPKQTPAKKPTGFTASFTFESPVSADYYVVPVFQSAGLFFKLEGNTKMVTGGSEKPPCVKGLVSELLYVSPGTEDALISDVTIGDPAKATNPDNQNRRFCLKQACTFRPPTSLVLTYELQKASEAKTDVTVCWASDDKEIIEVE